MHLAALMTGVSHSGSRPALSVRDPALLSSLRERVADASGPDRALFAQGWFACTGKQSPDTKARFAILLDAKAWIDAALLLARLVLPEGRLSVMAYGGIFSILIGTANLAHGAGADRSHAIHRADEFGWAILAAVLDELLA
jgi:hypothetical protein